MNGCGPWQITGVEIRRTDSASERWLGGGRKRGRFERGKLQCRGISRRVKLVDSLLSLCTFPQRGWEQRGVGEVFSLQVLEERQRSRRPAITFEDTRILGPRTAAIAKRTLRMVWVLRRRNPRPFRVRQARRFPRASSTPASKLR